MSCLFLSLPTYLLNMMVSTTQTLSQINSQEFIGHKFLLNALLKVGCTSTFDPTTWITTIHFLSLFATHYHLLTLLSLTNSSDDRDWCWRKEMFYSMTHSTHFYTFGVSYIVKNHSDSEKGSSSHETLAEILMAQRVHNEGSIRRPIAPRADALPWSYISFLEVAAEDKELES